MAASSSVSGVRGALSKEAAAVANAAMTGSQDWPISRWVSGKSSSSPHAALSTAPSLPAARSVQQTVDATPKSHSSSQLRSVNAAVSSSTASSPNPGQTLLRKTQNSHGPQTAVRNLRSPVKRSHSQSSITSAVSPTHEVSGSIAAATTVLSPSRKSLAFTRCDIADGPVSAGSPESTAHHINGNSVTSYVSRTKVPEAATAVHASSRSNSAQVNDIADPLLRESHLVMQWFGMDNAWFENDFLPFADRTLQADVHTSQPTNHGLSSTVFP